MIVLNSQQIFDAAWDWAVVQKKPRCAEGPTCYYRHQDNKCLLGAAIPDSEYTPEMEGNSGWRLHTKGLLSLEDINFTSDLQVLHDNPMNTVGWTKKATKGLRDLAKKYNLVIPKRRKL